MNASIDASALPVLTGFGVPALFSPGLVFQRNRPIHVWGWGPEGAVVEVALDGAVVCALVTDGSWDAVLPPRAEGGPLNLTISSGNWVHRVEDVLIGEVVLCAGQSNMEVAVSSLATREEILPEAENARLRIFVQDCQPVATPAREVRNGRWARVTRESAPAIPAVPLLLGVRLQQALGVPVGILVAAVGGSGILSWLPREVFARHEDLKRFWEAYPWKTADEEAVYRRWLADRAAHDQENARRTKAGETLRPWTKYLFFGPRGPYCVAQPAGLFHGMLHPLSRFQINAAVWYQGETDAEEPSHYQRNLEALMAAWRSAWGLPELRFFVVQLVRCGADVAAANWPAIREAQALATDRTEGASLVPALDFGEVADLHPSDKALLGDRLGRFIELALMGGSVPRAPKVARLERLADGDFEVFFSRPVRGVGEELGGFEAAGTDGVFRRVSARWVSPRCVRVAAESEDRDLRYLWSPVTEVYLLSEDGLPPIPFRTDSAPAPFREEWHYMSEWPAGAED